MSISSEISSIEDNLRADYNSISNMGIDLTNVDKNIENIAQCVNQIYNNAPKTSFSEGTEVTLQNCLKGKIDFENDIVGYGDTEQESTKGIQLIDINSTSFSTQTTNDVKITNNGDGSITLNGTATANTSMRVSTANEALNRTGTFSFAMNLTGTITGNFSNIVYGNSGTAEQLIGANLSNPFQTVTTTTTYNQCYMWIWFASGTVFNNATIRPMFVYGEYTAQTMPNWEKYTGGIPAPNPSFPFQVKSVTGELEEVVSNKNLIPDNWKQGMISVSDGITISSNPYWVYTEDFIDIHNFAQVTVSFKETCRAVVFLYDENKTMLGAYASFTTLNHFTYTRPSQYYLRIGYNLDGTAEATTPTTVYTHEPMLEIGNTATSYVAHQEVTKPLNLGSIELNKIGTYQDYIYKNNDKWYKHEEIGKVTLNGSEEWLLIVVSGVNSMRVTLPNAAKNYGANSDGLSNMAIYQFIDQVNKFYFPTRLQLAIGVDSTYTLETWKSYLANNNLEARYALNTETDIEITDTTLINQLENWYNAQSFNGTTIITSNGDLPMPIKVRALKGE